MKSQDILSTVNRRSGMTVPEGYFEEFAAKMTASLPEQPWEKADKTSEKDYILPHKTLWNTIRPYVYMAAMFAGVWCMMKMFDFMRPSTSTLGIDNNPYLAEAVSNTTYVNDYILDSSSEFDDMDSGLYDDLYNEGFSPVSLMTEGDDSESVTSYEN